MAEVTHICQGRDPNPCLACAVDEVRDGIGTVSTRDAAVGHAALRRIYVALVEAEALATRADSAQRGRPKPAESALEAAWATLERWQSAADFRHFVISSQEFYTVDIYDAGSRRSTKPWRLLSDALCEAVEFIVEFMPLAATPEGT